MSQNSEFTSHLAEALGKPLQPHYAAVKALMLYWRESVGMVKYQDEAKRLGAFFKQRLGYELEEFEIPTRNSHMETDYYISKQLLEMQKLTEAPGAPCLLIIHYGGHGDKDDVSNGQGTGERRSVWRGDHSDEQIVRWYQIQQNFQDIKFDVLLLLDCCYAATAARGPLELPPGTIELLAASADRVGTPGPGEDSFTSKMINQMNFLLGRDGRIHILALQQCMAHRRNDSYTSPFHVMLRIGPHKRSIFLDCLTSPEGIRDPLEKWKAAVHLCIRMREPLTEARVKELITWLHGDAPSGIVVGFEVEKVLNMTTALSHFVSEELPEGSSAVVRSLDESVLAPVGNIWRKVHDLVSQYVSQHNDSRGTNEGGMMAEAARRFLGQIDQENRQLLHLLQRQVLTSPAIADPIMLESAVEDPVSDLIGLKDQLILRRVINSEVEPRDDSDDHHPVLPMPASQGVLEEFKTYGRDKSANEIEIITARIGRLASVLKANKPEAFCCLQLLAWRREPSAHRFLYQFAIPPNFRAQTTLYEAMLSLKHGDRPTLDERLMIAHKLAGAVEQWHQVDWVHQGISSHNVLFFKAEGENRWCFSAPYLQGFEFSRPKLQPSTDPYVENIDLDIYRHPDRQGICREGHTKIHDLYSLGIVLLEIGIWRPARVMVKGKGVQDVEKTVMVAKLQQAARDGLAHYAGVAYQEAVLTCLTSDLGIAKEDMSERRLSDATNRLILQKLRTAEIA